MLSGDATPRPAPSEVLWGDAAPAEHAVQFYSDTGVFLDALEGFASGGLRAGESVVIIASQPHRAALERRLRARGFDLEQARAQDRYLDVDASAALAHFVVDGEPDEARLQQFVGDLLARARRNGSGVRAFGEMVVLLWNEGHPAVTERLEALWDQLSETEGFRLFCAYPLSAFGDPAGEAMETIRGLHSREIPA